MKRAPFRRLFSLVLSLIMMLSVLPARAGDVTEKVILWDYDSQLNLDGSIIVTDPENDFGALILDMSTQDASVSVTGKVEVTESTAGSNEFNAVKVYSMNDITEDIDIGKGIAAATASDNVAAVAVDIDGSDNGVTDITVSDGSILASAAGKGSDAVGVFADMRNKASVSVQVSDAVEAKTHGESSNAESLMIRTQADSSVAVKAGNTISAEADGHDSFAVCADVYAVDKSTVSVDAVHIEAVTNGKDSYAKGTQISYGENAAVSVSADGISAKSDGTDSFAAGIGFYETTPGGKVEITVGSDGISASSGGTNGSAVGAALTCIGNMMNGDVSIVSEGDITAEASSEAKAVFANVDQGSSVSVKTDGSVTAVSGEYVQGVAVNAQGNFSLEAVTIKGSSQYDNGHADALEIISGEKGKITVDADKYESAAYGADGHAFGVTFYETSAGSETTVGAGSEGITAKAEGQNGEAYGVAGQIVGNNTVTSQGDISAKADSTAKAVSLDVYKDGTLNLYADDIVAESKRGESTGVELTLHGGKAVVETKNDITAGTKGISVENHMGADQDIMTSEEFAAVKDKAHSAAPGSPYGFEYMDEETNTVYFFSKNDDGTLQYGEKKHYYATDSAASVAVTGSVNVTSAENQAASGITINSDNPDAVTEITVGNNVTVKGTDASAVDSMVTDGTVSVKVDGNVSADASGYHGVGVNAYAENKGKISVDIAGSVTASAKATKDGHGGGMGVFASAEGADTAVSVSVAGGITAEAKENGQWAEGVVVLNDAQSGSAGQVDIQVNGDIQSTGGGMFVGGAMYQYLDIVPVVKSEEYDHTEYTMIEGAGLQAEKVYFNAEGGYYYNEYGNAWKIPEVSKGQTKIEVKGDVTGDDIGLEVKTQTPSDIIIDGTLKGGSNAVVLANETVADNMKLTVWEIVPNEDGSVVQEAWLDQNGTRQVNELTNVEKDIQYIIRLEQPEAGATLSTEGTREYEGYTVANEGDNVVLKVNLEPGYTIVDAFNGTDTKVSLLQAEDGSYYLVVPRGGAVLLSVSLRKVFTGTSAKSTVTIDCNGGILSGPLTIQVSKNAWITLPDAPVREGAEFLGWYASECPRTDPAWVEPEAGSPLLLPAGSQYQVTTDNIFLVAIWQEA